MKKILLVVLVLLGIIIPSDVHAVNVKVLEDTELDIEEKVIKLIRKCNARGGNDNISIAYLVKESGELAW